jgi:hypothetical protein
MYFAWIGWTEKREGKERKNRRIAKRAIERNIDTNTMKQRNKKLE